MTSTHVVYEAVWRRMSDAEIGDAPAVQSAMQAVLTQKVQEVAESRLAVVEPEWDESDRTKVRSLAIAGIDSEASPEFRVAVQAVCDFRTAQAQAREYHMFHTEAPPGLSLRSIQEPVSAQQSILHHNARSIEEVICITRAFGITGVVRDIIPLTPERLVLHTLTQRFILDFSLQGELSQELEKIIPMLSKRFLEEHPSVVQDCIAMRADLEAKALHYLRGTGEPTALPETSQQAIDALKAQVVEGSGLTAEEIQRAIAMRVADVAVTNHIRQCVKDYDMTRAPELTGYAALPSQTRATRRTVMINGGVASGKSSSQVLIVERLAAEGVKMEDVCVLNRDAFKPMLLKPGEVDEAYRGFFPSLTEDEAYLLRDAILTEYKERLVLDTAPHLHMDQVSPTLEMMMLAGGEDSRGLDITLVYTPVETSFHMAYNRGRETGYHAVSQGVLNTHAGVPVQLLENLKKARAAGKTNIRLTLVANISKGVVRPVVFVDFSTKTGRISDRERLLMFFRKAGINLGARRFNELYLGTPEPEAFQPQVEELMAGIDSQEATVA